MPTDSRVNFGFAFLTPTGRKVRSKRKIAIAMKRFIDSGGHDNGRDGVEVVARWRNPDDKAARSQQWKTTRDPGQSLANFYDTMNDLIESNVRPKVEDEYENYARAGATRDKGSRKRSGGHARKVSRVSKGRSGGRKRNVSRSRMGKGKGRKK